MFFSHELVNEAKNKSTKVGLNTKMDGFRSRVATRNFLTQVNECWIKDKPHLLNQIKNKNYVF